MRRRDFALFAAAAVLAACSPPAPADQDAAPPEDAPDASATAAAFVSGLYDPYIANDMAAVAAQAPWSISLSAAMEAYRARSEMGGLDFDPIIDAQDFQIAGVSADAEAVVANSHAVVRARFTNNGEARELVYDLVWENGEWRVDNIRGAQWDLRQVLAN